jgi:arsenate reductase
VDELPAGDIDVVVTLCGHANETCPFFPGRVRRVHRGFDDPPSLCAGMTDEAEIMAVYRRVRDEIREFVAGLPGSLNPESD